MLTGSDGIRIESARNGKGKTQGRRTKMAVKKVLIDCKIYLLLAIITGVVRAKLFSFPLLHCAFIFLKRFVKRAERNQSV